MSIFKNFLKFSYGNFIGIFIGLLITIISTRIMSPSDFGIANIILIIINILMMVSMGGTDQSFIRFFHESDDKKKVKMMRNSLFSSILLSLILTALLIYVNRFFEIFTGSTIVYIVILIGTIIQIIYRMSITVIRMEGNGLAYSQSEIINKIFILISFCIFSFFNKENYLILVISTLAGFLGASFYAMKKSSIFWTNIYSYRKEDKTIFRKDIDIKEYYKYGIPLMITTTITLIFQATDRIILGIYVNPEDLGMYSAAMKLISLLMVTQIIFSNYWVPLSYKKRKEGNENKLFKRIFEIVSFSMIFLGFLVILMKDVIVKILGNEYGESANLIPYLVFLPIFYTLSEITSVSINFMKRTNLHIVISITTFIFNIVFCIFLVKNFGVIGASISSASSYLLFYILRSYFGVKSLDYNFNHKITLLPTILLLIYATINSFYNIHFYYNFSLFTFFVIIIFFIYKKITIKFTQKIFDISRRFLNSDN